MIYSRQKLFKVFFNLGIILILLAAIIGPFTAVAATDNDEPWSFGVMGDTQWTCPTDPAGQNPGACAVSVINQLNAQFIEKGVKFVVQVGDLTQAGGNMAERALAAQALYDAGIGFFPMRGNHDMFDGSYGLAALRTNFPQTQGLSNTYGAINFSSPDIEELAGISYAFDFNNASFVILDDWATVNKQVIVPGLPNYPYGYSVGEQQDWISNRLDKATRGTEQAFVFAHHNLIGENHFDCLFTGFANSNIDMQNTFFSSLYLNDVRYFISGHEHLYNRSLITSPDGLSTIEDIICSNDGSKYINPRDPNSANFCGQKVRQTQISQELNNIGFYIFTVDGPRVIVDYYADKTGGYLSDANWPKGPGEGNQITPTFNFILKETWGYSLNGREFLVPQGQDYTSVTDSFKGTTAQILSGVNDCTDTDFFNRPFSKTIDTGWTSTDDFCNGRGHGRHGGHGGHGGNGQDRVKLHSNILTLWGMSDFGTTEADTYVLSMSYEKGKTQHIGSGSFGIAAMDTEGNWVNAVDLNSGGTKSFSIGAWQPEYGLGTYGVDPSTKTAWAVLNYTGDFAVSNDIEPVPGHRK